MELDLGLEQSSPISYLEVTFNANAGGQNERSNPYVKVRRGPVRTKDQKAGRLDWIRSTEHQGMKEAPGSDASDLVDRICSDHQIWCLKDLKIQHQEGNCHEHQASTQRQGSGLRRTEGANEEEVTTE